ncbi:hypothetical protein PMIN06_004151 [Paraphaeosphaeria minitans]|uniref:Uncharacterized protein n=1 Tax=Paraphaeosphaeria minitans TaxID=565426 RepID=A0A9P6KKN3_9PLEO|nr:hypothetical protein PMIN01_11527 [Paraphaeosphaeria minitans]
MDSVCRYNPTNASTREGLTRDCRPQSKSQDKRWEDDAKSGPVTQIFPVTLPWWRRLWFTTARIRLRTNATAKWSKLLKLVSVGVLAATQKDRTLQVFTLLELARLDRGVGDLSFPPSNSNTLYREATNGINTLDLHDYLQLSRLHARASSRWDAEFFKDRKFNDREFFILKKPLDIDRDDLDYFLERYPSTIPSWKVESIKSFCSIHAGPHLRAGESSSCPDKLPRAWVDSRVRRKGLLEVNTDRFCAPALHNILKETRSGEPVDIEAYRQLIHITHLDEEHIRALAVSAWEHQAAPLRDAMYKHVDRQASLNVYIPHSCFKVFNFECHLPYLALRWKGRPATRAGARGITNRNRTWTELSFLGLTIDNANGEGEYEINELHSSLVVLGWDESKWAAYGFTDADSGDDSNTSNEEGNPANDELDHRKGTNADDDATLDDLEGDDDMYAADVALEDHLASDGGCDVVSNEHPIWDPRLYFLKLVDLRLRTVRKEWSYLVNKCVSGVRDQNNNLDYPFSSEPFSGTSIAEMSVARLIKTLSFLNELRQEFQATTRACERFLSPKGDHSYFSDSKTYSSGTTLQIVTDSVRHSFQCLVDLERRLASLEESCQKSKESIERCMSILQHKENAFLSKEANELSKEANTLTRESNLIAAENQTVAAASNLNAALMVNMNQLMTPVVIVVGYFSIEGEIFGFRKTAKSFLVSVTVLFFVLYLVNLVVEWEEAQFELGHDLHIILTTC